MNRFSSCHLTFTLIHHAVKSATRYTINWLNLVGYNLRTKLLESFFEIEKKIKKCFIWSFINDKWPKWVTSHWNRIWEFDMKGCSRALNFHILFQCKVTHFSHSSLMKLIDETLFHVFFLIRKRPSSLTIIYIA